MKHQIPYCEYAYQRQNDVVCFKQSFCEYKSRYPDFHVKHCERAEREKDAERLFGKDAHNMILRAINTKIGDGV